MWLLIDLQKNDFKGYDSFSRLKKDIGLPKELEKPSKPLKIGEKYIIREIEVNEKL